MAFDQEIRLLRAQVALEELQLKSQPDLKKTAPENYGRKRERVVVFTRLAEQMASGEVVKRSDIAVAVVPPAAKTGKGGKKAAEPAEETVEPEGDTPETLSTEALVARLGSGERIGVKPADESAVPA